MAHGPEGLCLPEPSNNDRRQLESIAMKQKLILLLVLFAAMIGVAWNIERTARPMTNRDAAVEAAAEAPATTGTSAATDTPAGSGTPVGTGAPAAPAQDDHAGHDHGDHAGHNH
jgi:hypothetical protein